MIVSYVTFSAQELRLRLTQRWRFLVVERGQVRIADEHIADFAKRGPTVTLTPIGPREIVRWVAWAVQEICPDAEAHDGEERIAEAPMSDEEAEKAARSLVAARNAAIAKEADPSGGAHEAVALITYLVKKKQLELAGPVAAVARAVYPLLKDIDETIGAKLEDALLDLDEVEELYLGADELTKLIQNNDHIFDR